MSRFVVQADWNDAPHLSEEEKKKREAALHPHQKDARMRGIPSMGEGEIYPIADSDIEIPDFELPSYWPRAYGMDFGWKATAAVWGAHDRQNDIVYLYSEYKRGMAEPPAHAAAIMARGDWVPGVCDPAGRASNQKDGQKLMTQYQSELSLNVFPANNAVEAGITEVWLRMVGGRLKVFSSLKSWFGEKRLYHRDDNGTIVKVNDHLMDCTRYLLMSGLDRAVSPSEIEEEEREERMMFDGRRSYGNTAHDEVTGY